MVLVVGFDQRPRRTPGRGALDHVADGLRVGIPLLPVAPVFLGDLEALELGLLALLEALQLLLVAHLQPELDDDGAGLHQRVLEVVDLGIGPQPVGFGTEALDTLDQHAAVPGAVEDRDPSDPRHVAPETPQIGLRALFVGRCRNRDDLVLAGIHRLDDTADAATLASGIRALEGEDQRMPFLEARVAHQLRELALPLRQFLLVGLLFQHLREVEFGQHRPLVDRRHQRRRHRHTAALALCEVLADRIAHDVADGQRTIVVVGALDDGPRGMGGIGDAQHVAGNRLQLVVGLEAVPARLGHPPGRTRVLFHRLQAYLLRILGEVEPELEHQRPLVDEHGLEAVDFVEQLLHLGALHLLLDTIGDRLRIPGAGEDADLPLRRQRPPVAPHEGALALLVGRRREGERRDVARVHPRIEEVDRLALAAAIDAADEDDHRKFVLLEQVVLHVEQFGAQLRHLFLEGLAIDLMPEFRRFKHCRLP